MPSLPQPMPTPSFSRPRVFTALAILCAMLTAAGCTLLDSKQRQMIFQPQDRNWQRADMSGMQEKWIAFDSPSQQHAVRLHALWLPHANPQAPVLLYLHGARWNVTASTQRMRNMQSLGFAVLAIDYRGFGQTTPNVLPSELSAREDAWAAWQWLAQQYPDRPRYLFGHSLGGAIAIDLATRVDDEQALIVEGTFSNIRTMARNYRWGWLPIAPLITQKFDSLAKIPHIGSPVIVVHGSADTVIPWAQGQQLYQAANTPKQWVLVSKGSHHNTNTKGLPQYRAALQQLRDSQAP